MTRSGQCGPRLSGDGPPPAPRVDTRGLGHDQGARTRRGHHPAAGDPHVIPLAVDRSRHRDAGVAAGGKRPGAPARAIVQAASEDPLSRSKWYAVGVPATASGCGTTIARILDRSTLRAARRPSRGRGPAPGWRRARWWWGRRSRSRPSTASRCGAARPGRPWRSGSSTGRVAPNSVSSGASPDASTWAAAFDQTRSSAWPQACWPGLPGPRVGGQAVVVEGEAQPLASPGST